MAKNVNIAGGGGGGVGSDELTSLLSDVVKGKTAVTSDSNDDPGVGTLELTGNAVAAHVLTGESFYTTDPKNKIVGAMIVNSVLSFSVAAYSGRRVLLKWAESVCGSWKTLLRSNNKSQYGWISSLECVCLGCNLCRSRRQCYSWRLVTSIYGFTSIKYYLLFYMLWVCHNKLWRDIQSGI